ncbi:MAG: hypothetical protein HC847_20500 [Hydrococcus sp. RU_2_2]|nr:hypothetical protein [Hydrococcus sp. RU_2_2]NJP21140.1 hypothetical protein [Hydrococcus sp. CRU_1_1]NJQ96655.1 hypothetical protein [Hydrococcus sp. CSU_1_8]
MTLALFLQKWDAPIGSAAFQRGIATNAAQQKLWRIILLIVISSGIISCLISAQAQTWWNKYGGEINVEISHLINQTERSLIIVDRKPTYIIPTSYSLAPNTQLLFVTQVRNIKIPNNISNIFLMNPTTQLRDELRQQNYQSIPIAKYDSSGMFQGMELWKAKTIN